MTSLAVRRSTRRIGPPATYEDLPPISVRLRTRKPSFPETTTVASAVTSVEELTPETELEEASRHAKITTTVSLPVNSARSISLDIQRLVDEEYGFLGKAMTKTGKAAVMEEAARLFSSVPLDTSIYSRISFNKYCGVQEWSGNRIFLWVNLGGKPGAYVNDFLDKGRQISWFGGSRMHSESNPIKKLLKVGSAARDDQLDASDGIVLWVRRFSAEKRTFGPYNCLGRLAYVSHDPGSIPISFVWALLD